MEGRTLTTMDVEAVRLVAKSNTTSVRLYVLYADKLFGDKTNTEKSLDCDDIESGMEPLLR